MHFESDFQSVNKQTKSIHGRLFCRYQLFAMRERLSLWYMVDLFDPSLHFILSSYCSFERKIVVFSENSAPERTFASLDRFSPQSISLLEILTVFFAFSLRQSASTSGKISCASLIVSDSQRPY